LINKLWYLVYRSTVILGSKITMKHTLFLIITLLFVGNLSAQDINQFDANGKRHGIWKKNFEGTTQPRYKGEFNHGKEVGLFKFYKLIKKKSVLTATKQFSANDNSAYVTFLSSRGKVISEGKMIGKIYVDKWKYYHKNSNAVMQTETYDANGLLQGEKLVFYKDGVVAERANYIDGKLQGESKWYSVKGVVLKAFIYVDDELHGTAKYYNPKGELIVEGQYKKGKKSGTWRYYENGELTKEKDFSAVVIRKKKQ
jgi:antitoxin component YwqK of YwqJK toxin-antitoxin module